MLFKFIHTFSIWPNEIALRFRVYTRQTTFYWYNTKHYLTYYEQRKGRNFLLTLLNTNVLRYSDK
jgi:hypothetical protein